MAPDLIEFFAESVKDVMESIWHGDGQLEDAGRSEWPLPLILTLVLQWLRLTYSQVTISVSYSTFTLLLCFTVYVIFTLGISKQDVYYVYIIQ